MKKIIFILTLSMAALLMHSCSDSLGIDPNVQRDKKIEDTIPDTDPVTIYDITQKYWDFYEYYEHNSDYYWGTNYTLKKNIVKMDTSGTTDYLWIEMEVESKTPDQSIYSRNDRVINFRIKLDSIPVNILNSSIYVSKERNNENWAYITVKNLKSGQKVTYNHNDVPIYFIMQMNSEGMIKGSILADIRMLQGFDTGGFIADFNFIYKQ